MIPSDHGGGVVKDARWRKQNETVLKARSHNATQNETLELTSIVVSVSTVSGTSLMGETRASGLPNRSSILRVDHNAGGLMNTFRRFLAAGVFGLFFVPSASAQDPVKPPSFLKVGSRYSFYFADARERGRVYGEILEFGPGPWMRVQSIVPEEPKRMNVLGNNAPPPGTKIGESWLNLAMLAAVVPAEKQSSEPVSENTASIPKVGTCYFFSGQGLLPYFGRVIELGSGGWFRAKEMNPKWSKDTPRNTEWWINLTFVSQFTEAKQKDLPE